MSDPALRTPTQSRAKRTRQNLVAVAQAEFSTKGYAQATASSIAKQAGVATGTFYQYFRDKDAVLYELAVHRVRSLGQLVMEIMQAPTDERLSVAEQLAARMADVVDATIAYHREDPGLHAVITERRHADPKLDELATRTEGLLVDQIATLLAQFGWLDDNKATAFVMFGMVEGAVHAHVLGRQMLSDERFKHALVEAMVRVAHPITESEQRT